MLITLMLTLTNDRDTKPLILNATNFHYPLRSPVLGAKCIGGGGAMAVHIVFFLLLLNAGYPRWRESSIGRRGEAADITADDRVGGFL